MKLRLTHRAAAPLTCAVAAVLALAFVPVGRVAVPLGNIAEPRDLTATVAAWNVLGMPNNIPTSRAKRIAVGASYLDPEVILLTEVRPHSIAKKIAEELNTFGASYKVKMPAQSSTLGIAILHKEGVTVSGEKLIAGSDLGQPGNFRKALTANVKIGQFDFILIGVHLKSGRSTSSRDSRTEQTKVIADFIETATQGVEKDVLVVGDYNMIPPDSNSDRDEENFDAMSPGGFLQFISSEDLAGQGSHISGSRMGNLLDGYAISFAHTNEYIDGSLRIFPLNRAMRMFLSDFKRNVSDHLPLVARFDIATADDDT